MLWGKSPRERADIVAQLFRHNVSLENLSSAQLSRLCAANQGNVTVALGHAGTRTVDRIVKKYGFDVLMRALDRATAPSRAAAE
jgi:hypothetical protein